MILNFIGKFFDSNEKELNKLRPLIEIINEQEEKVRKLKDEQFPKKTDELKQRLSSNENIDELIPEICALVREASRRVIGERHFDVQLMAAISLHQGKVAEQKTGEGKTLSATIPLYLNSLFEKGTHLVTVNDYLARVGCGWMGPIYNLLGVSVSTIISGQQFIYNPEYVIKDAQDWRLRHLAPITRKQAYSADITYGVNSEFVFDYLRDNMTGNKDDLVQKGFNYAIIDEVDSVLIDEARTPHIISAPDVEPTNKYSDYAKIVERLRDKLDYEIDEKSRTANLSDHGIAKIEKWIGVDNLFEKDFATLHHIEAALKAKTLFKRDKDYIVKDGVVVIVDEFTGRLLEGRRFSEGIHQAIEAKEGVQVQRESKTLATVSLQNYFRKYEKLAGMTGTAATEAEEFHKIYNLDVVVIPTNKSIIRKDRTDLVYKSARAKYAAVSREVEKTYKKGQPVLVGTTSIEHNQIISQLLKHKGIKHNVLNAKNHAKEAQIISDAGKKSAITVATNMAGRGVDIILGGAKPDKFEYQKFVGDDSYKEHPEYKKKLEEWEAAHKQVLQLGGLHVIGTERHESRRIDNQLRGRSGRQGDPGSSRFFVSLNDDIMRLFGGEQVANLMTRFNLPEDQPLEHGMVSRAIEQAQVKVEGFNFDIRKNLVEYDDVLNKQREIIYRKRLKSLDETVNTKDIILNLLDDKEKRQFEQKEKEVGESVMRDIEKWVILSVIDALWMEHLDVLTDLREGIRLRGFAQKDPLVEYKNEAFALFEKMIGNIDYEIARRILRVEVAAHPQIDTALTRAAQMAQFQHQKLEQFEHPRQQQPTPGVESLKNNAPLARQVDPAKLGKTPGRNDPCPCGSSKKYKKCHLNREPQGATEQRLFQIYFSDPEQWKKETGQSIKRKKK